MDIAPDASTPQPTYGDEPPARLYLCVPRCPGLQPCKVSLTPHHRVLLDLVPRSRRPAELMEVASLQHLGVGDSFSRGWLKRGAQAPPFDADVVGHSFGSSSRSFIDIDPAEVFSMRWTTTAPPPPPPPESDFEFGLPGAGGSSDPPSPVLDLSASQIIRDGRLLPSEPVSRLSSGAQQHHGDRVADLPSATTRSSSSSPLYHSAQTPPVSLSSCSSGKNASARPPLFATGRRGRSSWKILVQYLRFLMPLYRKVRSLRRFSAPRPRVAPASPARASTSSMEWCHGNADTAVRDAILYCKKSSGQDL